VNNTNNNKKRISSYAGKQSSRPNVGGKPAKRYKRRPSAAKKQRIISVLILFLTLYALINLLVAGFVYFSFNRQAKEAQIYSLRLNYDGKRMYSHDAASVNNAYGLYVPFGELSELCDLSIVGDSEAVVILLGANGDGIECRSNSSLIFINDSAVRLSAPVLFGSDDFLIPVELVQTYIIGVDVTYDDKEKLCVISREADGTKLSLKMLQPTELEKTYFPEEYKVYQ